MGNRLVGAEFATLAIAHNIRKMATMAGAERRRHRRWEGWSERSERNLPGIDRELQVWGDHAIKGTPGAEVIPELKLSDKDYVVPKRRYSGFFQTDLDILLKELGVKTVIITGLHTHMCCRHTSADAYMLGYDVVVAKEATNAFTEEDYQGGLAYLKTCYGADAYSNDELIAAF